MTFHQLVLEADLEKIAAELTAHALSREKQVGALLRAFNAEGWTPIHCAAMIEDQQVMEMLLTAGGPVNVETQETKETPLHFAALWDQVFVAEQLLKRKADVDAVNATGATALHRACEYRMEDTVELLLGAKANVDATDSNGSTPLHIAARENCAPVVAAILAAGADVRDIRDKIQRRPVDCAPDLSAAAILLDPANDNNALFNWLTDKGLVEHSELFKMPAGTEELAAEQNAEDTPAAHQAKAKAQLEAAAQHSAPTSTETGGVGARLPQAVDVTVPINGNGQQQNLAKYYPVETLVGEDVTDDLLKKIGFPIGVRLKVLNVLMSIKARDASAAKAGADARTNAMTRIWNGGRRQRWLMTAEGEWFIEEAELDADKGPGCLKAGDRVGKREADPWEVEDSPVIAARNAAAPGGIYLSSVDHLPEPEATAGDTEQQAGHGTHGDERAAVAVHALPLSGTDILETWDGDDDESWMLPGDEDK